MAGVNKVILVGNLGKDPEVFTFESGNKKVSFTLATTEAYKNKEGQRVEQTEWHNIVLYRGLADVAMTYLKKGNQVFIEGRIKTRSWEDNGQKRYATEIEAQSMTMLGSKRPDGENTAPNIPPIPQMPAATESFEPSSNDDLPF